MQMSREVHVQNPQATLKLVGYLSVLDAKIDTDRRNAALVLL